MVCYDTANVLFLKRWKLVPDEDLSEYALYNEGKYS